MHICVWVSKCAKNNAMFFKVLRWFYRIQPFEQVQGDTKKRELLKCVVAAMYSWQHCGTGTLSYRQPLLKGKL